MCLSVAPVIQKSVPIGHGQEQVARAVSSHRAKPFPHPRLITLEMSVSFSPAYPHHPAPGQGHFFGPQPKNGFGVASLVLGIVGIILGFVPFIGFVLAGVLGLTGVTLGVLGILRARRRVATNIVMAVIGTCLSVLALLVAMIGVIIVVALMGSANQAVEDSSTVPLPTATAQADGVGPDAGQAAETDAASGDSSTASSTARYPGQLENDVFGDAGSTLEVGSASITSSPLTRVSDAVGRHYCTDVTITNTGTETLTDVSTYSFSVQNPQGAATNPAFTMVDGELSDSDIAPGGTAAGKVCFDADQVSPGENVVLYEEMFSFSGARGAWVNTID